MTTPSLEHWMLIKTEKGRQELRPGHRSMGQRERAVLLLVDGQQPEEVIAHLFCGDGRALIDRLLRDGYLNRDEPGPRARGAPPVAAPLVPATRPGWPARQAEKSPGPAPSHGDPFAGTRSLASARMFLFDLSERLFAPRDKALAQNYRDALREARDGAAMLAVSRTMIAEVQRFAGGERADGIRERLAKLLPADLQRDPA